MAASLARVSRPRSWAASAAEVAWGIRPPPIEISIGVPGLGSQVPPVQGLERLARQEPQPEEQRHRRRFADILRQAAGGLQVGVLDHVGGIDPPL